MDKKTEQDSVNEIINLNLEDLDVAELEQRIRDGGSSIKLPMLDLQWLVTS